MATACFVQVPAAETWTVEDADGRSYLRAIIGQRYVQRWPHGPALRVVCIYRPPAFIRPGARCSAAEGPPILAIEAQWNCPSPPSVTKIRDFSPDRVALWSLPTVPMPAIGDAAGSDQRVGLRLNGQPTLEPFDVLHGGRRELSNTDAFSVLIPCRADAPVHPAVDSTGHSGEIKSDATIVVVLNLHRHDVKHDTLPCLYRCLRRRISRPGC